MKKTCPPSSSDQGPEHQHPQCCSTKLYSRNQAQGGPAEQACISGHESVLECVGLEHPEPSVYSGRGETEDSLREPQFILKGLQEGKDLVEREEKKQLLNTS